MKTSIHWHLRDIILIALIGIFFGGIYMATTFVFNGLTALLTPIGWAPMANDITIGIWVMAGPLAGAMLQKVGAGFLGNFLGAAGEIFFGGQWGASTLISGVVQGVGSELGFALTGYKNFRGVGLWLSVLTTTIVTFGWDMFRNGYARFTLPLMLSLFIVRLLSTALFSGVLVHAIIKLIDRSHVLSNK